MARDERGIEGATRSFLLLDDGSRDGPRGARLLLATVFAAAAAGLGGLLLTVDERAPLLPMLVENRLDESGVSNPVTAVLLNFRAYDTLLEVAVLVGAMVAVWSLDRGSRQFGRDPGEALDQPVLHGLARLVVPLAGVTAVYLTWMGSHGPGGAFQAGALLAGAGVLLTAAGFLRPPTAAAPLTRAAVAAGLLLFAGVGLAVMPRTGSFLAYPEGWAYPAILTVEAVLTVSVAVVLVELFVDVTAVPEADPALARVDPTGDPLGRLLVPEEGDEVPGEDDRPRGSAP
jgi:multisubunit Na+/H+ antiporter MnhB subunit